MANLQFPRQKVHCDEKPFSSELLHRLLGMAYGAPAPFTGYLKLADVEESLFFLFFHDGKPCAAGRYSGKNPSHYSIQDLGDHLTRSIKKIAYVSLCETDLNLLNCTMLFLRETPDIKAPVSLIDIDNIVRQLGETDSKAMVALIRENRVNFFYFQDQKAQAAYFADPEFERHDGMTIDEELQLYAFQPGSETQAFIFRDTTMAVARDLTVPDSDTLFRLLTEGTPRNRRKEDRAKAPTTTDTKEQNHRDAPPQEQPPQLFVLTIKSGPLKGARFTILHSFTIGRGDCDLILDDRMVSRRHAEIRNLEDCLYIEDLQSRNGTKVNGEVITRQQLTPNDVITIGSTELCITVTTV